MTHKSVERLIGECDSSVVEHQTPEPEVKYLHPVVSMSKTLYSPKVHVLVIPTKQWLSPDMTEKLLTGMLSLNRNKQKKRLIDV